MATVRSTFDLNSRPASSALRSLRKEGAETETVMRSVGESLDGIGTTKQREQVRLYREAIKKLGTAWEKTAAKQEAAWTKMEKKTLDSVALQSTAIDTLQGKVDELGRSSPTVAINTRGVAESTAEVELLLTRLRQLDHFRATARVGVGGTTGALARSVGGGMGGGGGGSSAVRSLTLGPLSLGRAGYPALIGGALGAAPPLLGAATGVLGSASAGTLGAGAIGLGGLGALSVGVGSLAAVAIPAVKGLKESHKALMTYNKAVAENGRNSTEAHTALRKLNFQLQGAPAGTRGLLNQEQRFAGRFQKLTKPGQSSFIGSLSNLMGAGNQLLPQFANTANPFMAAGERQSQRLSGFLTGGTTRNFLGSAGATAIETLPDVESTFQHVLATLMNISHAAMPFFRESIRWLESWTEGWAGSTGNIDKTRKSIGGMVSNLKSWGRLTSATFGLLKDLLSGGTKPGQSLVDDLTKQLNEWDKWVNRNPRKVRAFFREAVDSTEKIAGALGKITGLIWKLGQLITPLLTQASQFVGMLDSVGLLSPQTLPLLIAGGAGVRNVVGGARGRILGTAGAGGMSGLGTGAGLGLAAGSVLGTRGGLLGRIAPTAFRGGTTYGAARALGMSRTAAVGEQLGALGAAPNASKFARGFGARFLPIAALMGGLTAISTPGGFAQRTQAAGSSLSLGLIPMPKTTAQMEEDAIRHAQGIATHYGQQFGQSLGGLRQQLGGIRRSRGALLTPQPQGGLTGFLTQSPRLDRSGVHMDKNMVITDEDRNAARALTRQEQQVQRRFREQAMTRGGELGTQFKGAFDIRKEKGALGAFEDISPQILGKIRDLGPAGGRVLAQNVLRWAKDAKRQNPKLAEAYEQMVNRIEGRFEKMGRTIEIINGQIYTGSSREWSAIAGAMANPIEKAKEQMSAAFTAIQRQAVGSLVAMGFSRDQAQRLVKEGEKGGETGRVARANMQTGPVLGGTAFTSPGEKKGYKGGPTRAFGGRAGTRIPGHGNMDTVRMADGGLGAPGELIVNPHSEVRADRFLSQFGTTLGRIVAGEKHRASTPLGQMYARGGRSGGILGVGKYAQGMGLSVSGGPGFGGIPSSGHASGSLHYSGEAYDVSGAPSLMMRFRRAAEQRYLGHGLNELFYDPYPYYIDAGHKVQGSIGEHSDHVHVGFFPGGPSGASAVGRMMGMAGAGGFKRVRAPHSGLGGVPGALAQRGMNAMARGQNRRLAQMTGMRARRGRGLGGLGGGSTTNAQANMQLGRRMMEAMGWGPDQWPALKALWTQESNWLPKTNPSSGAYGIPQALGHGHPYDINDIPAQIRWGLKYIKERYGSPSGAWSHEQANNWYGRGGRMGWGGWHAAGGVGTFGKPTLLGVGEGLGKEDVQIRPHRHPGRLATARGLRGGGGGHDLRGIFEGAHFHVRKDSDLDAIAEKVGGKILEAMVADDGIDEEEVTG